jgi:hypothetical protein
MEAVQVLNSGQLSYEKMIKPAACMMHEHHVAYGEMGLLIHGVQGSQLLCIPC